MVLALDFPLGRPLTQAALVRRVRPLPEGASAAVALNDQVRADQPIAEYRPQSGPLGRVVAGLSGRVCAVEPGRSVTIESLAAVAYGIVGLGGPAAGPLAVLARGESLAVAPIARGSVILFPHQVPLMLLQRAAAGGAVGIIAASVSARELEAFARADLSMLLDGLAPEAPRAPLTLVITEGLGTASMSTGIYQFLSTHLHDVVLLDGATNPRRGIRPEILLSAPPGVAPQLTPGDPAVVAGAVVAVVAGERRGARGEVVRVFGAPQQVEGGLRAPAVLVRFEDGAVATVAAHALDRIG